MLGWVLILFWAISLGFVPSLISNLTWKVQDQHPELYNKTCKRYDGVYQQLKVYLFDKEHDYIIKGIGDYIANHYLVKRMENTYEVYKKAYKNCTNHFKYDDFRILDKKVNELLDEVEKTIKIWKKADKTLLELDCYEAWEDKNVLEREMNYRKEKQQIREEFRTKKLPLIRKDIYSMIKQANEMIDKMSSKEMKISYKNQIIEKILNKYCVSLYEDFLESGYNPDNIDLLGWIFY